MPRSSNTQRLETVEAASTQVALKPGVSQVWECSVCGFRYESPLRSVMVSCSSKHRLRKMTVVAGAPPLPPGRKELPPLRRPEGPPPESLPELPSAPRVKVGRVANPSKLLEAFGIKESS